LHPVVPKADGSALLPYSGPALTIEGELNKVASNIATGRNIAGVHWRSAALSVVPGRPVPAGRPFLSDFADQALLGYTGLNSSGRSTVQ
jgi:hypothetical protein